MVIIFSFAVAEGVRRAELVRSGLTEPRERKAYLYPNQLTETARQHLIALGYDLTPRPHGKPLKVRLETYRVRSLPWGPQLEKQLMHLDTRELTPALAEQALDQMVTRQRQAEAAAKSCTRSVALQARRAQRLALAQL